MFHFARSEDEEITTSFQIIKGFLFLQLFPAHSSRPSVKQENREEIIKNLGRMRTSHLDKTVTRRQKKLSKETEKGFEKVCRLLFLDLFLFLRPFS